MLWYQIILNTNNLLSLNLINLNSSSEYLELSKGSNSQNKSQGMPKTYI